MVGRSRSASDSFVLRAVNQVLVCGVSGKQVGLNRMALWYVITIVTTRRPRPDRFEENESSRRFFEHRSWAHLLVEPCISMKMALKRMPPAFFMRTHLPIFRLNEFTEDFVVLFPPVELPFLNSVRGASVSYES